MKSKIAIKYIITLIVVCGMNMSANAFLIPPGPMTPTVDPVSDITFFMDTATTTIQNATAQASAYVQSINQQAKAALSKYTEKFTGFASGMFKKEKKQPLPGTKEIKESKNFDIFDPVSVQAAIYELFFEYPVDCNDRDKPDNKLICQAYDNLAQEFYEDTIIELYTSTRELEKQFEMLENSVNELETALNEGKNGAESPEDENGVWKNAYNAYDTMNSILKIIEEVEAMRIQYIAVQTIGTRTAYPMTPEPEDKGKEEPSDKNALNDTSLENIKLTQTKYNRQETLQFAQKFSETQDVEQVSDVNSQNDSPIPSSLVKQDTPISEKNKPVYKRSVNFVAAPESRLKSPYADNQENLALLEKLNNAYEKLKNAIEVHNQIKGLSTIQEQYNTYNKTKKLHEKALQSLKLSEQCAINYYREMYDDPEKMWNGGVSIDEAGDLSKRKGISGWAVTAYNLAKAEDTGMVIDSNDFNSTISADTSALEGKDEKDRDRILTRVDRVKITKDDGGFKDASKEAKVNESLQESERLPWNIGSQAAQMLALDQAKNGKNGKWGKAHKLYPVWKDTQAYYMQYLEGKYDGIKKRLNALNMLDLSLLLAEELNNLLENQEERQHNATALSSLSAKIKKEKTEATSDIDKVISSKKAKLDQLYNAKEQKLANLAKQKQTIINNINQIQEKIDNLSFERQDAMEQKQEAETTATAMEDKIKRLYKRQLDLPTTKVLEIETKEYKRDINATVLEKQSYNTYRGFYERTQRLANAQMSVSPDKKVEKENFSQEDIKTYIETKNVVKEIENDEPEDLIEAQAVLEDSRQQSIVLGNKLVDLAKQIEKLKNEQEILKNRIETEIKPQEEAVKAQYVIDTNEATLSFDKKIQAEEEKYAQALQKIDSLNLASYYKEHFNTPVTTGIGELYLFSLPDILQTAQNLVSDTRNAVNEMISDTLDEMAAMGDNLYNPNYHEQVVSYHKELMNKLKTLPQKELIEFSSNIESYSKNAGIMALLKTIYQTYIIEDACTYNYCYTDDIEYFVSNNGKRRDFRAPMNVPEIPLPTMREMVYFDYQTYDNIAKTNDNKIAAEELLQNIPYIPEIWKYILRSPAYVEKDIDLSTIIIPSPERLANGGIYPCLYKGYLVTSLGDKYRLYGKIANVFSAAEVKNEEETYKQILEKGYQPCQNIEISGNGRYLTVKNIAEDVSGEAELKSFSEFKETLNNSELGQLLAYNEGLKYNTLAEKSFKRLSEISKEGDDKQKQKDVLYDIASLNQNQIGDFLKKVDFEQECRQNMAEMSVEIKSTQKTLNDIFSKIGFEPSPDFNLSKEDDYNQAYDVLLRYRNQLLASAIAEIKDIQSNDNEVIAERMTKLNNLIKALQKDNKAYTVLEETSEDNAELDENIKSEQANRKVLEKHKKEAEEDFKKQLNQIGNVYCAELVGNM